MHRTAAQYHWPFRLLAEAGELQKPVSFKSQHAFECANPRASHVAQCATTIPPTSGSIPCLHAAQACGNAASVNATKLTPDLEGHLPTEIPLSGRVGFRDFVSDKCTDEFTMLMRHRGEARSVAGREVSRCCLFCVALNVLRMFAPAEPSTRTNLRSVHQQLKEHRMLRTGH